MRAASAALFALVVSACGNGGGDIGRGSPETSTPDRPDGQRTRESRPEGDALSKNDLSAARPEFESDVLCADAETTIFQCPMPDGKALTICRTEDGEGASLAQYRYGPVEGPPEIAHPKTAATDKPSWVRAASRGGEETRVEFIRRNYRYVIYSGAPRSRRMKPDTASLSTDGVLIYRDGHFIGNRRCAEAANPWLDASKLEALTSADEALFISG